MTKFFSCVTPVCYIYKTEVIFYFLFSIVCNVQTGQKVGGTTRAASMRAAAVRRRSIETEQANNGGKPVAVHGAPHVGLDAEERAAARAELTKKRLAKEELDKETSDTSSGTKPKSAAGNVRVTQVNSGSSEHPVAVTNVAPARPKPPSAAKSVDHSVDAAVAAARPKSRLYTPKGPSSSSEGRSHSSRPGTEASTAASGVSAAHRTEKTGSGSVSEKQEGDRAKITAGSTLVPPPGSPSGEGLKPKSSGHPRPNPARPKSGPSSQLSPQAPNSPAGAAGSGRPKSSGRNRNVTSSSDPSDQHKASTTATQDATAALTPAPALSAEGSDTVDSQPIESSVVLEVPEDKGASVAEIVKEGKSENLTEESASVVITSESAAAEANASAPNIAVEAAVTALPDVQSHEEGSQEKVEEDSGVLKSAVHSVVAAETPLDYSMDFENSSANAEVFKVHD